MKPSRAFLVVFAVFACLNVGAALLYYAGAYRPEGEYEGEFYLPYYWLSGPVAWILAVQLANLSVGIAERLTLGNRSSETAIIIIPGVLNSVIGSIQWFVVVWLIGRLVPSSTFPTELRD